MKYRYLGNSGLAVSTICLGTATFGRADWGCDKKTSVEILNTYLENGGNFIDTSDQYANKKSESIIGEWIKNQNRDNLVIATKCFFPTSDNINDRGLSRKHIINACDASLKRLNTDYIDLYQIHEMDIQTPLEETLDVLNDLVRVGKVRYIGFSNLPAWIITKAFYISKMNGYSKFISGQFLYNILKRDIEREIIPCCQDFGIGVLCWSPLSGGMLTGKYKDPKKPVENSRIANRIEIAKGKYQRWYKKSFSIVRKIIEISNKYQVYPSTISLAWLLKNKVVSSVIIGATNSDQVIENCMAGDWVLPEKEFSELNKLSSIENSYPYDLIRDINKNWFDKIL